MDKWKERLVEMLTVRNELYKADKGQLWEYHYPEVAAEISESATVRKGIYIAHSYNCYLRRGKRLRRKHGK